MTKIPHTYALVRIDIEKSAHGASGRRTSSTHGYQVRIKRKEKRYSKFFSDDKYKGRTSSKSAALMYRDSLLLKLGITETQIRISKGRRKYHQNHIPGFQFRNPSGYATM